MSQKVQCCDQMKFEKQKSLERRKLLFGPEDINCIENAHWLTQSSHTRSPITSHQHPSSHIVAMAQVKAQKIVNISQKCRKKID